MTDVAADRVIPDMGEARAKATLETLLRRIWDGVCAHRGLVAAVFVIGFFEALFTKAPLVLVKFLIDALDADPGTTPALPVLPADEPSTVVGEVAASVREAIREHFFAFSNQVNELFGLGFQGDNVAFVGCGAAAAILGVFGSVAIYGTTVLSRYFAAQIVVDLRNDVLAHILRLPMRFFAKRRMGELISSITTDTAVLTRSFTLACDHVITDPLQILGNFVLLLIYAPQISWIMLLLVPAMALPMIRTGKKIHRSSSKSLAAMGESTESMNQVLTGIRTVKAFQLEQERLDEFRANNARYLHRTKRMLQAKGYSQGLLFASYQIAFAAMLCAMGYLVTNEELKLSDIVMVILPLATTYQHVKRLARSFNILNESVGALEGIEGILRVGPDVSSLQGGATIASIEGRMAMEHVSFAYEAEQVLQDVSFTVAPGQTVAVVGPSGAGKSTALDLLARFYDPTAGRVTIDGRDLRDIDLSSYRRHIAMVSQQPFLFNTTILENIRYGRRDATDAEVEAAARKAQIHDFVVSQPLGYHTVVGERGGSLSGGQMQRVTIARAILRDPRILFLDEATSALDSENEGAVQQALDALMAGRTCFVIAHRLSTIQSADMILVMEAGRLVEQGVHDELLARRGLYYRLCQLQQLGT